MSRIPIAVVVPTRNETNNIRACLAALRDFDQVVVVDSQSDDDTTEVALKLGAEVIDFKWDGQYPKKKQWVLDKVTLRHDWVLFIDADEMPDQKLVWELDNLFRQREVLETYGAFDIDLDYAWGGVTLRHGHRVTKRALVHRERTRFPVLSDLAAPGMGEQEGHYQPMSDFKVGHLKSRILHHDHDPLSSWFSRHNRYSDWEAYLRKSQDVRSEVARLRSRQGRRFDRVPLKPLAFFLYCYIVRRGFLDKRAGFDYAIALSFYYWQISIKQREGTDRGSSSFKQLRLTPRD